MEQHTTDVAGRVRWFGIAVATAATLSFGTVVAARGNADMAVAPRTSTVASVSATFSFISRTRLITSELPINAPR